MLDLRIHQPLLVWLSNANKVAAETGGEAVSAPITYEEWIVAEQTKRNSDWKQNVLTESPADTEKPMKFDQFTLFQDKAEAYAMENTTIASANVQVANEVTQKEKLFAPCMVGAMESQFLKMQCQVKGAKRCLDWYFHRYVCYCHG